MKRNIHKQETEVIMMQTRSSSHFPVHVILTLAVILSLALPSAICAGAGGLDKVDTDKKKEIPDDTQDLQLYTEGNLVVKLISPDSIDIGVVNAQFGTSVDRYLGNLRLYLLNLPPGGNPDTLADQISQLTWVEYAHPNYLTDPLNPVQGSYPFPDLQHVGDYDQQAASNELQLTSVHQDATGAGVVVGVLDGGVDYTHPELTGRVSSGWDYIDQDADAMDEPGGDNSGHGTFVAGVINLIAPDVSIRSYRVVDVDGTTDGYVLAEAIMQAVDDGCDVINLSLAMQLPHAAVADAIAYAKSQKVVVVAAAGNGNDEEVRYPASDVNTIAVAAVDSLNRLAPFSNYGSGIDVCAPGAWIYSPYQDEGYAWWDGTSFAAPFVAGQAALLREISPLSSVTWLRNAILGTANNIDNENPSYIDMLGSGLIDPLASITSAQNGDSLWISPDTLFFSMPFSSRQYTETSAYVRSTNAPAAYIATISNAGDWFASLLDTVGFTNDSVGIGITPYSLTAPGTYYATASYAVDGIPGTAQLVIKLTLAPDSSVVDSAWANPSVFNFTVSESNLDSLAGCISINSTNQPSSYLAYSEVPTSPPYVTLQDSSGATPDSICFTIAPIGLSPGMYGDSIYFWVDGLIDPVKVPVWVTVTADSSGSGSDSGWVEPSSLSFQFQQDNADTVGGFIHVRSSNPPTSYWCGLAAASQPPYIWISDTAGSANDSIYYSFNTNGLTPGTYCDTLVVAFSGIPDNIKKVPICVTVVPDSSGGGGADSAWATPSTMSVTAAQGTAPIYRCAMVHATNHPAAFQAYGSTWISVSDSTGTTGDSSCFAVIIGSRSPGTYSDTASFLVEGIDQPATVVLSVTILPDSSGGGGDSAWASPPSFYYEAVEPAYDSVFACVSINSSNAPAPYTIQTLNFGDAPHLQVLYHDSLTNDSVCFSLSVEMESPGLYCDTLVATIAGVSEQLFIPVCYRVLPDSSGGGSDSAWAYPSSYFFQTTALSNDTIWECVVVNSSNAPASYTVAPFDPTEPPYLQVLYADTLTNDSTCFMVTAAGLNPGIYCDSLVAVVDGVDDTLLIPVCLEVLPDSSGGGAGDSVLVLPDSLLFTVTEGSSEVFQCFQIVSTVDTAAYTIAPISFSPIGFVTYLDTAGVSPDTACIGVAPGNLTPGTYCETYAVWVDGIEDPDFLNICLTVLPDSSGGGGADSAWVTPPLFDVNVTQGTDADSVCFTVHSTNEPANYTVLYDTGGFLAPGPKPQTGGVQCATITSAALPVGLYCDTMFVVVDGIPDTVYLSVCLQVFPGGGDTMSVLGDAVALDGNYPNPFNPETNISFTLPRAMDVQLSVYNVLGRHIKTLVDRPMTAGQHVVVWDGRDRNGRGVASGIYFYRLTTEETVATRKMLLLK